MSEYTAVGITTFVLGKEADGNREIRVYENGDLYSVDPLENTLYSDDSTEFPII